MIYYHCEYLRLIIACNGPKIVYVGGGGPLAMIYYHREYVYLVGPYEDP